MTPSSPINILIVDDHPENLVALEHLLDEPDCRVIKANSGNEALQLVLEHDIALVLLDVQMPDMNGFETAELMRANHRTRRIPIIFVTAISREQRYVFQGYEAGAVDYISKPIEPLILKSKVRVFVQLHRQKLELEAGRQSLALANAELASKNKLLQDELEIARHVQLGFLPKTFPRKDRVAFGQSYQICTTLGGDLFDAFSLGADHVGLYIADVSGHGVSAALISGLLKMSFESQKSLPPGDNDDLLHPERITARINAMLFEKIPRDTFITMIYAVLDLNTMVFHIANAGHPRPLRHLAADSRAGLWDCAHGPALGITPNAVYPASQITLTQGDKVIFYTDGITEAMCGSEEFGEDRLLSAVQEHGREQPDELVQSILSAVETHRAGTPVADDCSLLVIQTR